MFRIVCDPSSGSIEIYFTEIDRSDSLIFFVCLVGVWQRNFEPVLCVCVRYDGLGTSYGYGYEMATEGSPYRMEVHK